MKYSVTVQETVVATYEVVDIEAVSKDQAEQIAEEMRVQGQLGEPTEAVEAVDFYFEGDEG